MKAEGDTICVYARRWILSVMALLGVAMTALSVFGLAIGAGQGRPLPIAAGAIGTVLFGWATVIAVFVAAHRRPIIRMDAEGLHVFRYPVLPWENFADAGVTASGSQGFLVIDARDPEVYFVRMRGPSRWWSRANSALADGTIFVSTRLLADPAEEVARTIRGYVQRRM